MSRDKDRVTPSTPAGSASEFASRSARTAMGERMPSAISVTPIPDSPPIAPRSATPAGQAVKRIRNEIMALALRSAQGEEVYLDVLGVRHQFEVVRVREASDVEVAFDGLDARGHPAKVVQHHTQISYHLRTEPPAPTRRPIGFHFHGDPDPAA